MSVTDGDRLDAGLADAEHDAAEAEAAALDAAAREGFESNAVAVAYSEGYAVEPEFDVQDSGEKTEVLRELTQDERTDVVLYNPNINAKTKVLMLIMARGTAGWTADVLAEASGMTRSEVQHALRPVVQVNAVNAADVPDHDAKKFVVQYSVTSRSVGYLSKLAKADG